MESKIPVEKIGPAEMKKHIDDLIKKFNIQVAPLGNWSSNWYDNKTNEIAFLPVINAESYWKALHEIGHFISKHSTPDNWDTEVKHEIEAWQYVYDNSIIPVPPKFKRWVNSIRMKGSWENNTKL
jgi:hypothetical protein